jgi:hypothetical protein
MFGFSRRHNDRQTPQWIVVFFKQPYQQSSRLKRRFATSVALIVNMAERLTMGFANSMQPLDWVRGEQFQQPPYGSYFAGGLLSQHNPLAGCVARQISTQSLIGCAARQISMQSPYRVRNEKRPLSISRLWGFCPLWSLGATSSLLYQPSLRWIVS